MCEISHRHLALPVFEAGRFKPVKIYGLPVSLTRSHLLSFYGNLFNHPRGVDRSQSLRSTVSRISSRDQRPGQVSCHYAVLPHAFDFRPNAGEFILDGFVAAVQMVDPGDFTGSIGCQSTQDQ